MSKRRRHTPEQIIRKLREAERMQADGADIAAVARQLQISEQTFHRWRNQYGGMKADDAKRLRELERENQKLKRIVADKELEIDASLGPNDDPQEILDRFSPEVSRSAGPEPTSNQVQQAAVIGTCRTFAGKIRKYSGNRPAGVGKGVCSTPMYAINVKVDLMRLSGSWYPDKTAWAGSFGSPLGGPAVAVSRNSCGKYYAAALAWYTAIAPATASPPVHGAATPIHYWCP